MPAAINLNEPESVATASPPSCAKAAGFAAIKPANAIAARTGRTIRPPFRCISIKNRTLKALFNGNYTGKCKIQLAAIKKKMSGR
jgi:hypothetical protein